MRQTVCAMLKAWEVDCVTAEDGEEGYELVSGVKLDLVITDLHMPNCDGYELLTKVSQMSERLRPPVIVLSGSLDDADRPKRHLLKQAACLLLKPVEPHCLHECLNRILSRSD
tara:strand:- start:128483 stop:128821 length:339 start_codon:yes stop_codon:yes gene_type:complete